MSSLIKRPLPIVVAPALTEEQLLARDRQINVEKNSGCYDRLADHRALSRDVWMDSLTGSGS